MKFHTRDVAIFKFFAQFVKCSTFTEKRDQTFAQVIAYKRIYNRQRKKRSQSWSLRRARGLRSLTRDSNKVRPFTRGSNSNDPTKAPSTPKAKTSLKDDYCLRLIAKQ